MLRRLQKMLTPDELEDKIQRDNRLINRVKGYNQGILPKLFGVLCTSPLIMYVFVSTAGSDKSTKGNYTVTDFEKMFEKRQEAAYQKYAKKPEARNLLETSVGEKGEPLSYFLKKGNVWVFNKIIGQSENIVGMEPGQQEYLFEAWGQMVREDSWLNPDRLKKRQKETFELMNIEDGFDDSPPPQTIQDLAGVAAGAMALVICLMGGEAGAGFALRKIRKSLENNTETLKQRRLPIGNLSSEEAGQILVRGSQQPDPSANELLRAAKGSQEASSDQLLRAAPNRIGDPSVNTRQPTEVSAPAVQRLNASVEP